MRSRAALAVLVAAGCMMTPSRAFAGTPPTQLACGQTVTRDVTLAADVTCRDVGTPGLVVGANRITIDLNGHNVSANPGLGGEGACAILNEGHRAVRIRDGGANGAFGVCLSRARRNRLVRVSGDGRNGGISISGGSGNTVRDARASGLSGLRVADSPRTKVIRTTVIGFVSGLLIGEGSDGSVVRGGNVLFTPAGIEVSAARVRVVGNGASNVHVLGGSRNVIARNWVTAVEAGGIFVAQEATDTVVRDNLATRNPGDGILVRSPSTRIIRNLAVANGDYGIEAVPGVFARGNRATGNGNPAQCLNVTCRSGP